MFILTLGNTTRLSNATKRPFADPNDVSAFNGIGNSYYYLGDYNNAAEYYQRGLLSTQNMHTHSMAWDGSTMSLRTTTWLLNISKSHSLRSKSY
ncbi:MAG: tetratricopeptide repeat protein [Saprospiraceae bacterium]|nr:tetratricopeptide repeat protein [Saprospiraceae bacterium]